jgi:hypothetical protein
MATRIRSVKPEFFRHSGLFTLEQQTRLPIRLAFEGLWIVADREGRFRWKPEDLKHDVLPYDEVDFGTVMEELRRAGFIVQYEADGKVYGYIPTWKEHQVVNHREGASKLPDPDPDRDRKNEENSLPNLFNSLTREQEKSPCTGGTGTGTGRGTGGGTDRADASTTEAVKNTEEKKQTFPQVKTAPPQSNPIAIGDKAPHPVIPLDLTELEYARRLLEDLGLPSKGNIVVVAESIKAFSKARASPLPAAFEQIRARAFDARNRGDRVDHFWFQDGRYSQPKPRSKSDVASDQFRDRFREEFAILERQQSRASRA